MTPVLSNRLRNEVWCIEPSSLAAYVSAVEASASLMGRVEHEPTRKPYQVAGSVAVVSVSGTLGKRLDFFEKFMGGVDYDDIAAAIGEAEADDAVEKVLLHIDSPGGSVTGTQELADRIRSSSKEIYALTDTLMASAGYYIGSQAKAVLATPSSRVGSVGAIILHQDHSGLLAQMGIKATAIFKGKHKADFAPFKPLSQAEKEDLEARVAEVHAMFKKAVKRARKVSAEVFESKLYSASEAVENGLVDGLVNNVEQALELIQ